MLQMSAKSTARFQSNSRFKSGTQKQKFPIWKSRLSSSYTITSVTVCAKSGRRLHGHTRAVEHATFELLGQWCSGRSNATPGWDAVSSGRRRESCHGRRVAGAYPTPRSLQDLGQGFRAATATVTWNLVYFEIKTLRSHQLRELEHFSVGEWRSLLLWNESVFSI